jgi:hypothetical protein
MSRQNFVMVLFYLVPPKSVRGGWLDGAIIGMRWDMTIQGPMAVASMPPKCAVQYTRLSILCPPKSDWRYTEVSSNLACPSSIPIDILEY